MVAEDGSLAISVYEAKLCKDIQSAVARLEVNLTFCSVLTIVDNT